MISNILTRLRNIFDLIKSLICTPYHNPEFLTYITFLQLIAYINICYNKL